MTTTLKIQGVFNGTLCAWCVLLVGLAVIYTGGVVKWGRGFWFAKEGEEPIVSASQELRYPLSCTSHTTTSLALPAGHMVPLDKPAESLAMITSFLKHEQFPVLRKGGKGAGAIPATVLKSTPDKRDKRRSFINWDKKARQQQQRLLGSGTVRAANFSQL